MDDAARVRVREPVEHLRRRLDRRRVVDGAVAKRVAQRAAGNVLVGDVDVAVVAAEVVGAHAALVAQARGRLRLAGGARRTLSLAGDDLERDVEAGLLVPGEPHRAGAAATERPERAIAVEDELSLREGDRRRRHGSASFAAARGTSSAAESPVHSSAELAFARKVPPAREGASVSTHDDDILDFDFFDDETREIAPPSRTSGGRPAEAPSAAAVARAARAVRSSAPRTG